MPKTRRTPDFSGWATKFGIKCTDGRTILKGAFSGDEGRKVPIVWQHIHDDPDMVLGHAYLFNKPEGVWTEGYFNNNPKAQEVKELLRIFNILRILRNDPAVDPDVGAFLRNDVFKVLIFTLGVNGFAGVDYAEGCFLPDHLVTDLVDDVSLDKGLLIHQQLRRRSDLIFIDGIDIIAEHLFRNHKSIADRILHKDVVCVFLIPEDFPGIDGVIHHGGVVKDSDGSPAVGDGVFVFRVEAF